MKINYLYKSEHQDSLEINNIGQCYIEAFTDIGDKYYLSIQTELGFTNVLEFGPISELMYRSKIFYINSTEFEFNQGKIAKRIDKFLNTTAGGMITQAMLIEKETLVEALNSIVHKAQDMFLVNQV